MKKMVTLLLAAMSFAAVHAQTTKDEARRVVLGKPKNSGSNGNTSTEGRDVILGGGNGNNGNYPNYPNSNPNNYPNSSRDQQIAQVNRDYNQKIYSIRNNPTLTPAEKDRMIRQLEQDRAKRIREINNRYSGSNKDYKKKHDRDDDRDGDDDHEHHDNGKHKGWTKGKGNAGKNHG